VVCVSYIRDKRIGIDHEATAPRMVVIPYSSQTHVPWLGM